MATRKFSGLRILRQDPWECLISYICATYKNIPAIKRMLLRLSEKYGKKTVFEGRSFFTFPTPTRLAIATVKDLGKCELGYRSEYVSQTALKLLESGFDLNSLRKMAYDDARRLLLQYPGVGQKVADCILLFSLGKLGAFPVDVWMRRVILRYYASHFESQLVRRIGENEALSDSEYRRLNLFGRDYFGEYAGYAQEYMYHYERIRSKE